MNIGIIIIGISIITISMFIYIVKNFQNILNCYKSIKIFRIALNLIIFLMIFICLGLIVRYTKLTVLNINWFISSVENDKKNEEYDKKIIEENKFYKTAMEKEYINQNSEKPYIPENFTYVKGEWNTGFVIQDSNQNQYVWVPCTNKQNLEIPMLQRKNFTKDSFISKDLCTNENYKKFINSSLENGGFYISRFEIGYENEIPVSKKNVEILSELNIETAKEIINKFEYNVNCELVNGYAYDTTLEWLLQNNQITTNYNNIKEPIISGKNAYNNIYDFFDNTLEITNEINYGTVIIRGSFLKEENENKYGFLINNLDRISILKEEKDFSIGTKLGFRTMIYK